MRKTMRAVAAVLTLAAVGAGQGAPAHGVHNFVDLGGSDPFDIVYWDAATVVQNADSSLDVSVLWVSHAPIGGKERHLGDLNVEDERYRVWCDARTLSRIDITQEEVRALGSEYRYLEGEIKPHLPVAGSIEERAIVAACAGGEHQGFATPEDAIADAKGRVAPPPPPLEIVPVSPPVPQALLENEKEMRRFSEIDRSSDSVS